MNGRVYDTVTARFISADPTMQAPMSTQGLNRYSYVQNNPLKYTDPSGYFLKSLFKKLKRLWRPLLAIAIAVFAPELLPFLGSWGAQFAGGFFGGLIMGQGDLQAGLIGGLTALAFFGVGEAFSRYKMLSDQRLLKIVAHGGVGGVSSIASGGKFGHGFLSSGFTQAFAPGIDGIDDGNLGVSIKRTVVAAVVGGTASAMGGGKFSNGAVTGAFSRAFNDEKAHYLSAKKAFAHYMRGGGKPLQMSFDQLDTGGLMVSDFQGVRDAIGNGPGQYAIDARLTYTERGENFFTVGDVTLRLQGELTVNQGGWSFSGNVKAFDDFYDFNPSTHRSVAGEALTAIGNSMPGTPYSIEIRGSRRIYGAGGN